MRLNRFLSFKEAKLHESHENLNELARKMVGDGGDPNCFFVTLGYGHIYDDNKEDSYIVDGYMQKNSETILKTDSLEEAMDTVEEYELDTEEQENMLTQIMVEDRKNGTVYEKSIHKNEDGDLYEHEIDDRKMLEESLLENRQLTKNLLQKGEISEELYKQIENADPTPQKKYMFWMAKQLLAGNANIDQLRNNIEEFDLFVSRGRIREKKDINAYKNFAELAAVVKEINERGVKSNKEMERDYDVDEDSEDLLIVSPHSHEASRKLGLSEFAYRKRGDSCGADSHWCTTFKTDSHFLDYYYSQQITFYYVKVRSEKMKADLKKAFGKDWEDKTMVAIVVHPPRDKRNPDDFEIDMYDAVDHKMSDSEIQKFRKIIKR